MNSLKILIVDDEKGVRELIKRALITENFLLMEAETGSEVQNLLKNTVFDLIILDIILKDMTGLEILKNIQCMGVETPVIFLTGCREEYDEVIGLGLGADDYITKPFSPLLLNAKVKAHLRRYKKFKGVKSNENKIVKGPFVLDLINYKLYKAEREIILSSKELLLMKLFIDNPNTIFSKEELYCKIWNDIVIDNNTIMVYIRRLRKKIEENPNEPLYLQTIWGIGYKFNL